MMLRKMIRSFLCLTYFILFIPAMVSAQESDCHSVLERAEVLYEEGIIEEIPMLLQPCINKGFTREQKLRAFKLMIYAYLFDDNQTDAQNTMLEFLKRFPEYEPLRSDPVEFVYLFESFKTSIVYSVGALAGINFSNENVIEPYNTANLNNNFERTSSTKLGTQFGLQLNRYLSEKLELSLNFLVANNRYHVTKESSFGFNDNQEIVSFSKTEFTEKISHFDFPLTLAYQFEWKDLNPFIRAGFGIGITGKSTAQLVRSYPDGSHGDITGADIDLTEHRNKLNYYTVFGTGFKYKVPRGFAILDIRYNLGLSNFTNASLRYSNQILWSRYYWLEDDFKLDNLSISIGYVLLLYQPSNKK